MKWLLGYNSLLSERKSKQQLNRRMNVKMAFWSNKLRINRPRRMERREIGKCQSQKRQKKLSDFFFMTIYLSNYSQPMANIPLTSGKE